MKTAMMCGVFVGLMVMSVLASAATIEWGRNTETDMKDYRVYVCKVKGCVVSKTAQMLAGTVAQTSSGVKPKLVTDLVDTEGTVAITARDLSDNESGLSVQTPFDLASPEAPAGPITVTP